MRSTISRTLAAIVDSESVYEMLSRLSSHKMAKETFDVAINFGVIKAF